MNYPPTVKRVLLTFILTVIAGERLSGASPDVEGQQLVRQMRDMRPAHSFTNTGVMEIRREARHRVPVYLKTILEGEHWHNVYGTSSTLVISHSHDGPNAYRSLPPTGIYDSVNLTGQRELRSSLVPFAGSDFWLFDLGLEFLQWPVQRVIGSGIKKTQSCHILESVNSFPRPGSYSRVVSWVDKDSMALVSAEAYDHQGRLWKRFEPKSLMKVDGKYRLREIVMWDLRADSKTTLTFDRELEK
jgi:hypothetical protein